MALSRVGEMGNKHKRGIKIVILTCFLIIVFFLLAYYFFQFIKRMKWDIVSFDVISLKIIIRCIFLYIISLKYYYINFILGQFRISKKIHLKISFLSHNKEKKRSHSIFFFFLLSYSNNLSPVARSQQTKLPLAAVRKKKEGYTRETYTNLNEPDPSAFRWIVSN